MGPFGPIFFARDKYSYVENFEMKYLRILIMSCLLMLPMTSNSEFIVNEKTPVMKMTEPDLFQIFLFYQKFWLNSGERIVVVLPPLDSALFKRLAYTLKLDSVSYRDSITNKMQREGIRPVIADSEFGVLIKVSNTPNSIGYYHDGIKYNDGYGIQTIQVVPQK